MSRGSLSGVGASLPDCSAGRTALHYHRCCSSCCRCVVMRCFSDARASRSIILVLHLSQLGLSLLVAPLIAEFSRRFGVCAPALPCSKCMQGAFSIGHGAPYGLAEGSERTWLGKKRQTRRQRTHSSRTSAHAHCGQDRCRPAEQEISSFGQETMFHEATQNTPVDPNCPLR